MKVVTAMLLVVIAGVLIPLLFGHSIGDPGYEVSGFFFVQAFNAICWGTILLVSLTYRHVASIWFPALAGLVSLGVFHALLDLSSDAQAAVALVFIPIWTLPFVLIGGIAGFIYDRRRTRRETSTPPTLPNA